MTHDKYFLLMKRANDDVIFVQPLATETLFSDAILVSGVVSKIRHMSVYTLSEKSNLVFAKMYAKNVLRYA